MMIFVKIAPWLILLLLIITWTPWRSIFEKIWGNNPKRAKVYVEAGEQVILCRGKMGADSSKGFRYRYKCFGEWQTVLVSRKYPYRYILGCRQIRVIYGQSTAAPLGGMVDSECVVSGETLDAIFRAHIGADLAKSIFGKALNIMLILMVVGGVLVVGYFFMQQMSSTSTSVQPPAIEQPKIIPQNTPLG